MNIRLKILYLLPEFFLFEEKHKNIISTAIHHFV
jgi:hypothetical protein